ncbi:MAG: choice-of-anchor Q domain-containing protein [Salinivirgaceae bacterium]|nr:choice-of-anchor Q domain-containing protein [Salinivirgaceae bacterium]MDD4747816.1 choice-of-anchor Q domain-containing protein [Salinivirgaceae bacterium]
MKNKLLFSWLTIFSLSLSAQTSIQVSGDVSGTWSADTVNVIDHIKVPLGADLIINPGVIVHFQGFYGLSVYGSIRAIGTESDSILFTATDTAGFSNLFVNEGGWKSIFMKSNNEQSDSSVFEYCRFEYAKTDTTTKSGGAMHVEGFSKLRISNCTFSNNRAFLHAGAIYLLNSKAKIEYNAFVLNHGGSEDFWGYGGAIHGFNSEVDLFWNHFHSNTSTGMGGACTFEGIAPSCIHNTFESNFSALGGALGVLRAPIGGNIINNLFNNNSVTFFGGAVTLLASSPSFVNNTVINGKSMYGGGIYFNEGSASMILNCIFWNNRAEAGYSHQVFVFDALSTPKFMNGIYEGGVADFGGGEYPGVYLDCNEEEPLFVETGENPFALLQNSPGVDGGLSDMTGFMMPEVDLAGNPRISNARIDMGAFEYQAIGNIGNINNNRNGLISWYNSATNEICLKIGQPMQLNSPLTIVSAKGEIVAQYNVLEMDGKRIITVPNHLPVGVYFASMTINGQIISDRFVVTP